MQLVDETGEDIVDYWKQEGGYSQNIPIHRLEQTVAGSINFSSEEYSSRR